MSSNRADYQKTNEGYREVFVDVDPAFDPALPTATSSSGLRLALSREASTLSSVLPLSSPRYAQLPIGARFEIAQDSFKIMRKIGEIIGASPDAQGAGGGAGLVVDYGGDTSFDSSFRVKFYIRTAADRQAFKNHAIVDVFEQPGTADLTANVDFAYLKESLVNTGELPLVFTR